jgi:hypothetical protein
VFNSRRLSPTVGKLHGCLNKKTWPGNHLQPSTSLLFRCTIPAHGVYMELLRPLLEELNTEETQERV